MKRLIATVAALLCHYLAFLQEVSSARIASVLEVKSAFIYRCEASSLFEVTSRFSFSRLQSLVAPIVLSFSK